LFYMFSEQSNYHGRNSSYVYQQNLLVNVSCSVRLFLLLLIYWWGHLRVWWFCAEWLLGF